MFGFCVRIHGLGMYLVYCECLARLVVLVLLSSLRGRCGDCIWGGVYVEWRACMELWQCVVRSWCVDFVQGRECVSNRRV